MTGFNLPPGCSVSQIPGNRPEDIAWDAFFDMISDQTAEHSLGPDEASVVWNMGLAAWKQAKDHLDKCVTDVRADDQEYIHHLIADRDRLQREVNHWVDTWENRRDASYHVE